MRLMAKQMEPKPKDAEHCDFGEKPIIDWFCGTPEKAAVLLTACGITDPFSWCRRASELSDGQRERLKMAAAVAMGTRTILLDEWLHTLDSLTARCVAWSVGRVLRTRGIGAIIARCDPEIITELQPDVHVEFGGSPEPKVTHRQGDIWECSVTKELEYRRGSAKDWRALKQWHYAAGDPATVHSYHAMDHPELDSPAAVALLSYPDLNSAARNLATSDEYKIGGNRQAAQRLNREVLRMSRIVVAPEMRGIGVASRLIEAMLATLNVRFVECQTAMGRYSGFLSATGWREVPQSPSKQEGAWTSFAIQKQIPPTILIESDGLKNWVGNQSVRVAREAKRLIWGMFHHYVVHRRTRKSPPKRIPAMTNMLWEQAFALASERVRTRPSYWIIGPLDAMTGMPEDAEKEAVRKVSPDR